MLEIGSSFLKKPYQFFFKNVFFLMEAEVGYVEQVD